MRDPLIVGIGGTRRPRSVTGRVLDLCLQAAADLGAQTRVVGAADLLLPLYEPEQIERTPAAVALVQAVREADGLVVVAPGYHGGISGTIKNALDYLEDLRDDGRPYLDGRAVGCVACASGPQASVSTLNAMRAVVHALRGWPTPIGVALDTPLLAAGGEAGLQGPIRERLAAMTAQVVGFARAQLSLPSTFARQGECA